ncbi:MAG TPA: hypothetical protein PLP05_11340 [Sedimentisphaerales bacterium]|nr:hypothetical protein [Sedimentisphaerales bacterium]
MARPTRKKARKHRAVDIDQLKFLFTGKFCCFILEDDLRQTWQYYRAALLDAWIQVLPGSRPWAWWAFDMPENTRREALEGVHIDDYPGKKLCKKFKKYSFGLPSCCDFRDKKPVYESEFDYLQRLGLLLEDEENIAEYTMQQNSCNSFQRELDQQISEILANLGYM